MNQRSRSASRGIGELIERSSLGSPEARAVRQTVRPELAAQLVAGAAARAARLAAKPRRPRRR
jgi:hypothetical protein